MLSIERPSGKLMVETDDNVRKEIFFQGGTPVFVASTKQDELLGNFLVNRGVITERQLAEVIGKMDALGGRLGRILVAEKFLPADQLVQYLFDQAKVKLLDIFNWHGGRYAFYRSAMPDKEIHISGIQNFEIITEGVRHGYDLDRLKSHFDEKEHLLLKREWTPVFAMQICLPRPPGLTSSCGV